MKNINNVKFVAQLSNSLLLILFHIQ